MLLGHWEEEEEEGEWVQERNSRPPANAAMEAAPTLISIYCSHSSPLSLACLSLSESLSLSLLACYYSSLLCPPNPNQMKKKGCRRERERKRKKWFERGERERENIALVSVVNFSFLFAETREFVLLCLCCLCHCSLPFYILYLGLGELLPSCPCLPSSHALSMTA